ncbi:MAG: hypothetical protein AAF927_02315 [Bacteroidota bacterium]
MKPLFLILFCLFCVATFAQDPLGASDCNPKDLVVLRNGTIKCTNVFGEDGRQYWVEDSVNGRKVQYSVDYKEVLRITYQVCDCGLQSIAEPTRNSQALRQPYILVNAHPIQKIVPSQAFGIGGGIILDNIWPISVTPLFEGSINRVSYTTCDFSTVQCALNDSLNIPRKGWMFALGTSILAGRSPLKLEGGIGLMFESINNPTLTSDTLVRPSSPVTPPSTNEALKTVPYIKGGIRYVSSGGVLLGLAVQTRFAREDSYFFGPRLNPSTGITANIGFSF